MIFVTVGAQMPFDRLVRAIDRWAGREARTDVFAQVGHGNYLPQHVRHDRFLDSPRFQSMMREATLVVAHAGMGSIITAMEYGKPILVMPRRGDLAETRNDHQIATAKKFSELGVVEVAMDEVEMIAKLTRLMSGDCDPTSPSRQDHQRNGGQDRFAVLGSACKVPSHERHRLVNTVKTFIHASTSVPFLDLTQDRPRLRNGRPLEVIKQAS